MILSSHEIAKRLLADPAKENDPLVISPLPDTAVLEKTGEASVGLRLGTWFLSTKARRTSLLDIYSEDETPVVEESLTNKYYVPFGKRFILHPGSFVLAVTLEWVRMPLTLTGMVTGKSSWGRRGLVIETAPGVHPGFAGCLTLELSNVGEIPISIAPGSHICQVFFHRLSEPVPEGAASKFLGQRQPRFSHIELDKFASVLAGNRNNK